MCPKINICQTVWTSMNFSTLRVISIFCCYFVHFNTQIKYSTSVYPDTNYIFLKQTSQAHSFYKTFRYHHSASSWLMIFSSLLSNYEDNWLKPQLYLTLQRMVIYCAHEFVLQEQRKMHKMRFGLLTPFF